MGAALKKILVVGGNGFIGSAVCRAALAKGLDVTSISSSGNPYQTPKGHSPAWVSKVDWRKGDALNPQSFAHLFPIADGVVHTLGTLLEDRVYKRALRDGNIPGLLKSFLVSDRNPLQQDNDPGSYEVMNRDTALRVCEAFIASSDSASDSSNRPRPFVYISAEDIFRPVIPARYISTKREAERRIEAMMHDNPDYRGVYIRPSLVYHPHLRPLTTPIAVLLEFSAAIHGQVSRSLPTPSSILRSLGSSFPQSSRFSSENLGSSVLDSLANALTLPPIHVDQVADAICATLPSSSGIRGVVGVHRMRDLIGWTSDRQKLDDVEIRS